MRIATATSRWLALGVALTIAFGQAMASTPAVAQGPPDKVGANPGVGAGRSSASVTAERAAPVEKSVSASGGSTAIATTPASPAASSAAPSINLTESTPSQNAITAAPTPVTASASSADATPISAQSAVLIQRGIDLAAAIVDPEARALSPSAIQNEFFVDRTEALASRIAPTVEISTVPAGVAEAQMEEQSNPPVEQTPVTFPSASITRVTPTVPVAPTAPVAASVATPLLATPSRAAFTGNVAAPSPSGPAAFAPVQPPAAAVESSVDATPDSVAVEVEQLVEATAVSQPITPKMPLLPARAPLPEISVPARLDRASSDGLDTPFYLAYAAVLAAALAGCVLIVRRI